MVFKNLGLKINELKCNAACHFFVLHRICNLITLEYVLYFIYPNSEQKIKLS